jgi:hypothetical protein
LIYYFRLAIQELHSSDLFDGPEDCRYFTHNVERLHNNHYFLAGQLLAMSIAYDGPSSLRLNEQLYDFMTDTSSPAFEDDTWRVLPMDARSIIQEVRAKFVLVTPTLRRFHPTN